MFFLLNIKLIQPRVTMQSFFLTPAVWTKVLCTSARAQKRRVFLKGFREQLWFNLRLNVLSSADIRCSLADPCFLPTSIFIWLCMTDEEYGEHWIHLIFQCIRLCSMILFQCIIQKNYIYFKPVKHFGVVYFLFFLKIHLISVKRFSLFVHFLCYFLWGETLSKSLNLNP